MVTDKRKRAQTRGTNNFKKTKQPFWNFAAEKFIQRKLTSKKVKREVMRLVEYLNWQKRDANRLGGGITQTQDYMADGVGVSVRTLQRWLAVLRATGIIDVFPNYQIIDGLPHRMANTIILSPIEANEAAITRAHNVYLTERVIRKKQWINTRNAISATNVGVKEDLHINKMEFTAEERAYIENRLLVGVKLWHESAFSKR